LKNLFSKAFDKAAICLKRVRVQKVCLSLIVASLMIAFLLTLNMPAMNMPAIAAWATTLELQSRLSSSPLLTQSRRENNFSLGTVETMTPEAMKSLIYQARDSWTTGNAEAFAALFTSDGKFIVPGQRWVGQESIRKVAAEFAASHSEVEITIQTLVLGTDQAVVEWTWKDVEKKTGASTKAEDAIVIDFKAGQISRWREYIDADSPKKNQE
jgi:uncharacterized protein (TIGR02246 family)